LYSSDLSKIGVIFNSFAICAFVLYEIFTFQHNFPGLRNTCASGPKACGCLSGRSLLVASVAIPKHPVSLPHYCEPFFRSDAPLGPKR
jgi:hypothetical protein